MNQLQAEFNLATIDLGALADNYRSLLAFNGGRPIMAVIKGEAYGHGFMECAQALASAGAKHLGVLDAAEGLALREAGFLEQSIYILGGLEGREQAEIAMAHKLAIFAHSPKLLKFLSQVASKRGQIADVFVKIDTGMGRLGTPWYLARNFLPEFFSWPSLRIMGLCTHLATVGDDRAKAQLSRFDTIKAEAEKLAKGPLLYSALSSGGLLAHPQYLDDLPRAGLALYGASPLPHGHPALEAHPETRETVRNLRPAMRLTSRVVQVRALRPGETVSYERTFMAPASMRVAVLPIGYVHGLGWHRSGAAGALIRGRRFPQVGRICMNLSVFDVSSDPEIAEGDEAVILGEQGRSRIDARLSGDGLPTSPYETLCLFGRLNKRVYLSGPKDLA
jgi:alanine racemase